MQRKNINMEDDSKVNEMKKKYNTFIGSLPDLETTEANFCQCSNEKNRNAFKTVKKSWNKRSLSSGGCFSM